MKNILSIVVIAILSVVGIVALANNLTFKNPSPEMKPTEFDYKKAWQQIDSLDEIRHYKDAEKLVDELIKNAKADDEQAHFVKGLSYKAKYIGRLSEENPYNPVVALYEKEIETATSPVKSILHSTLGTVYQRFADENRYRLSRVTYADKVPNPDDIYTWSLTDITNVAFKHFDKSLTDSTLKTISSEDYQPLITKAEDANLRPTLYDVLAHRAIDYYVNTRSYLSGNFTQFYLEPSAAFGTVEEFLKTDFKKGGKLAGKYNAVMLFKDILAFHKDDKDPSALVDTDLKRLKFARLNSTQADKDELYISALKRLQKKYRDHEAFAEISSYLGDEFYNRGASYRPITNEANKWDWKHAFSLYEEGIKAFPDSYGGKLCQQQQARLMQKSLSFGTEKVNLPSQKSLAWVQFRNVNKIYLKVVPVGEDFRNAVSRDGYKKTVDTLNTLQALNTWEVNLPDDGDLHEHRTEIILPALPEGEYFILASDNEYFSYEYQAVALLFNRVSNISYFTKTRKNGQEYFYVVNRETGKPIPDVKAEFFHSEYNPKTRKYEGKKAGEGKSDVNGIVINRTGTHKYFSVKFSKAGDYLWLDDSFYDRVRSDNKSRTTQLTEFFLDRAIYRPGQTVYFKALLYEKDYRGMPTIAANRKVKITFKDANHQEVETKEFTSNEYGTINGSFQAPTGGLTGQMHLTSNYGRSYSNRKYFRVEEYKRPKFEVAIDPVKGSYKINDDVKVTGNAKAYAGNNIDGAKVTYAVRRKTIYPYWRWWWGYQPNDNGTTIKHGETVTDADGNYEIIFRAEPDYNKDEKQSPQFNYEVDVTVTDITGETHTKKTNVSVGYIALRADINIPEQINKADLAEFKIITQNLNRVFEPAKGNITIYPLQAPNRIFKNRMWNRPDVYSLTKDQFYENVTSYPYKDEDDFRKWEKGSAVANENFDTDKSKILSLDKKQLKSFKPGKYVVVMKTQDKFGKEIEVTKFFELFDLEAGGVPANAREWFYADNKAYEPGSTASVYYGSAYYRSWVLFEVYDNEQKLIKSEWTAIKNLRRFDVPILEEHRGNIGLSLTFITDNRGFNETHYIKVPWSNKDLNIEYSTFRDKLLPGQEEEWQVKISGYKKDKVAAEVVAAMYDASLDAFASNHWGMNVFPTRRPADRTGFASNFTSSRSALTADKWQPYFPARSRDYPSLKLFQLGYSSRYYRQGFFDEDLEVSAYSSRMLKKEMAAMPAGAMAEDDGDYSYSLLSNDPNEKPKLPKNEEEDFSEVKVRTNLNETVFFKPDLKTDAEGNVIIKFTMNEALTRWNFMVFGHTKDLATVSSRKTIVTQKDLMVMPNPPRFFRENDVIYFTAKVSNLSESDLNGTATLQLFDALTNEPIDAQLENNDPLIAFDAKQGQSAALSWKLRVPDSGLSGVTHRVIAKAGNFSDGEESTLPVLTNRMLLVETMPMSVKGEQSKDFTFKAMNKMSKSQTLKNHKATLEFTSNPAWYAVQALPYLMEYPYECTEQVFSRYYSNSLATSVTSSHPKLQEVFKKWKDTDVSALASNLSKNEELKYALLEETPWVLASQNEALQKKNIGLLFDLNKMNEELGDAAKKIAERQTSNGGFAWFPGGRDSWYITQYLVEGMGHLNHLGVNKKLSGIQSVKMMGDVLTKAVKYTDNRMVERYDELEERVKKNDKITMDDNHLSYLDIHYLYARSFYRDIKFTEKAQKVHDYFMGQAEKFWMKQGLYGQGMLALALHREDKTNTSKVIGNALKQQSLNNEELGMYWHYNYGYYWYQLPIETHALMIEVFDEVMQDDASVNDLKLWMLKAKQTTHWKTTKATAAAVYALLLTGDNWLMDEQEVAITIGGDKLDQSNIKKEAGTGHFKVEWQPSDITASMANITINNPNKSPAWGAMYWQYFEDLDKVESFEDTPLKIVKTLYKEVEEGNGPTLKQIGKDTKLGVGDKIKVRIELRVDRTMEYVHMKDMRASGFEPINVLSQYKWQNGLGYYESTRDAATNFFFSYLPKGTYVFEYPLRAVHKGDFSNGVTTIQCMYAPEFTSHSVGKRVTVE